MTVNVNIHEAKTHLSRLIERVAGGERVIISKTGQPVAELNGRSGHPAATPPVRKCRRVVPSVRPGVPKFPRPDGTQAVDPSLYFGMTPGMTRSR